MATLPGAPVASQEFSCKYTREIREIGKWKNYPWSIRGTVFPPQKTKIPSLEDITKSLVSIGVFPFLKNFGKKMQKFCKIFFSVRYVLGISAIAVDPSVADRLLLLASLLLSLLCDMSGIMVCLLWLLRLDSSINSSINFWRHAGILNCSENLIYVFPDKELRGLSPNLHIHVPVNHLYIPRIGPHIFQQRYRQTDRGNICRSCSQTHERGYWDSGRSIPFLGIFVSNFRYCVFAVCSVMEMSSLWPSPRSAASLMLKIMEVDPLPPRGHHGRGLQEIQRENKDRGGGCRWFWQITWKRSHGVQGHYQQALLRYWRILFLYSFVNGFSVADFKGSGTWVTR